MTDPAAPTLVERYLAMPRALQWAALAAVGMALFLLWSSVLAPLSEKLERDGDRIAAKVNEVRAGRQLAQQLRRPDMESLVTALGPVETPRSAASGSDALNDIINDLLKKHGIADPDYSQRTRGKLPKNVLLQVLNGKRAERLAVDLKFSARPEVAMAILAELEASPNIEQVASVRLTKDQNLKVKAHFVLEAWVVSEGTTLASGATL